LNKARIQVFDGLNRSLGIKDREKSIYSLAKGQERKTRDLDQVKFIKYEDGKIVV